MQCDGYDGLNAGNVQKVHIWRLRRRLSNASVGLICMSKVSQALK